VTGMLEVLALTWSFDESSYNLKSQKKEKNVHSIHNRDRTNEFDDD